MQALAERLDEIFLERSCGVPEESYPGDLPRLLRLGRHAKRKEHGEKRETKDAGSFTIFHRRMPIASFHLITLSALASTFGGMVSPICFADMEFITRLNFVGCSTGRSAGFVPFRILSTKMAARRHESSRLAP